MTYRVAVVGTGPGRSVDISGQSHSFAYPHADSYTARDDCELIACADIVRKNAKAFADEFDIEAYENHSSMLESADPDIVSVCTPIPTHAEIVIDCARHHSVDAVHCEKPMADTWAAARAMAQICDIEDVQLTFGHQRRFGDPFRTAKDLLEAGEIGCLDKIEISWGNFFDNGTHMLDLAAMFNDEHRATWVMGQLDYSMEHVRYGVQTADHAFVSWQYENGVHGIAATGDDVELTGGPYDFYDCWQRLVGTEGVIEIGRLDGPALAVRRDGEGWITYEVADEFDGRVDLAIDDIVTALDDNHESELSASYALNTTEILFAGHESSRIRGRVTLPLTKVYDHPLESMIKSGEIRPSQPESGEMR